jgi:hypothetical protein
LDRIKRWHRRRRKIQEKFKELATSEMAVFKKQATALRRYHDHGVKEENDTEELIVVKERGEWRVEVSTNRMKAESKSALSQRSGKSEKIGKEE